RLTHEHGATTRGRDGLLPPFLPFLPYLIRTADLNGADAGVPYVHLIVVDDPPALQRLRQALRFPQLPHERDTDDVRTGCNGNADRQSRVATDLHVLFPGVVAGESRLAVSGVAGCGRPALRLAADGEPLQQF